MVLVDTLERAESFVLDQAALVTMVNLAMTRSPSEACGALLYDDESFAVIVEAPNRAVEPQRFFVMEPDELRAAIALQTLLIDQPTRKMALWHSHPVTGPMPSRPDTLLMQETQLPMIIVSLWRCVRVCAFVLDEHYQQVQQVGRWRL